uniref:hypothetical protein n=1 Tax=Bordetella sputigena TaxID=1416810 RepID=UPI0039F0A923
MNEQRGYVLEASAVIVVTIGMVVAIRGWPDITDIGSQTWAAWVQALAAAVAIWWAAKLGRRQMENELKLQREAREAEESRRKADHAEGVRRVMQALRDEIAARWTHIEGIYGPAFIDATRHSSTPMLSMYNPMPLDPFPVFKSLASRIAEIPHSEIRNAVVKGYAVFEGLILAVAANSELAKQYHAFVANDNSLRKHGNVGRSAGTEISAAALEQYYPIFNDVYRKAKKEIVALIEMLNAAPELRESCSPKP